MVAVGACCLVNISQMNSLFFLGGLKCCEFGLPRWLGGNESVCSAGDARDEGSVPGLERASGEGNGNHSSVLAWRIPWTEEPGGLQRVKHD